MTKDKESSVERRDFLKGALASAATLAVPAAVAAGTVKPTPEPADEKGSVEVRTMDRSGSDFMVDVIKTLGIEFVCSNPANTFRALQESIINYGGNKNPEFIEESAAAMCNGYFKIEGKPAAILVHGTVGLQHATMGIYNSYADKAPI